MPDEPVYSLRYYSPTPEEIAARRADLTWRQVHGFMEGWGWVRGYADTEQIIWSRELPDRLTLAEFVKLKAWRQDAILADLKAKKKEEYEARQRYINSPEYKPLSFDTFAMPVIKAKFPKLTIDDLVGVEPIARPRDR